MSGESTIIHVGYPKTATKWFQRKFYTLFDNVFFVDRDLLSSTIIYPDIFNYSHQNAYNAICNHSGKKQIIICDELLLGGLDIGYGSGEFIEHMASRLNVTFEKARVVIFIRNQHTMLESIYSHYVKAGGTYSVKKFFGLSRRVGKQFMDYHLFNPSFLYYNNIVSLYSRIFGKENVYVYLYEDFLADKRAFIEKFCADLDLEKPSDIDYDIYLNTKLSGVSISFMRFFNHFTARNTPFKNYLFNFRSLYPLLISTSNLIDKQKAFKPFRLNHSIHCWIDKTYRDENIKLQTWIDIEKLKQYGYPL